MVLLHTHHQGVNTQSQRIQDQGKSNNLIKEDKIIIRKPDVQKLEFFSFSFGMVQSHLTCPNVQFSKDIFVLIFKTLHEYQSDNQT